MLTVFYLLDDKGIIIYLSQSLGRLTAGLITLGFTLLHKQISYNETYEEPIAMLWTCSYHLPGKMK